MLGGGAKQWNNDECELEEVEEEGENEHECVDEDQEADLPARQRRQQAFNPDMAADAVERQREYARADQNEEHEGRQFGCGFGRLAHQVPGQSALKAAEDQRAA